ncbi:MAG: glycosyltransferase [Phycisphaeraceae bacterium]|nr:glycosyltransferase [Phycisphaeraceae bacterium]
MPTAYLGERPSLAIVIPAFNAAGTIGDTLASIAAQSHAPHEVIVVDDGSTDQTARVAARHSGVRVIRQANTGLAGARNRGLRSVCSQAVTFLDADDTIKPEFVERMTRSIRSHDVSCCAYEFLGPRLEALGWPCEPTERDARLEALIEFNPFAIGALAFRTDVLRGLSPAGPFDPSLSVHEDWAMLLRLSARGARWTSTLSGPLFGYRLRPGSMSTSIAQMGEVGERVIASAPVEEALKPGAIRRWRLRTLARAMATGDKELCAPLIAALKPIGGGDADTLAGALRHALCRADCVGPKEAPSRAQPWRERVAAAALGAPWAADAVGRAFGRRSPSALLDPDLLAECADAPRVVVYGVGRNGRALMGELRSMPGDTPVAWMDDSPAARAVGLRIDLDDLAPGDLVVVTPDDHAAMLARLAASFRGRVRLLFPTQPLRRSA